MEIPLIRGITKNRAKLCKSSKKSEYCHHGITIYIMMFITSFLHVSEIQTCAFDCKSS